MSEELLMENKLMETGSVVFIKPHVQFVNFRRAQTMTEKDRWEWGLDLNKDDIEHFNVTKLIELAGRCCYKSEDKITEESADKFIKMIVKSRHHSVLEHVNITVKYVGSRAMSHQLVRHRIAAYSQESQRYCNYNKSEKLFVIMPPEIFKDYEKGVDRQNERN